MTTKLGKRRVLFDDPSAPPAVSAPEPPPVIERLVGERVLAECDELAYVIRDGIAHPFARVTDIEVHREQIDVTTFNDVQPVYLQGLKTVRYGLQAFLDEEP